MCLFNSYLIVRRVVTGTARVPSTGKIYIDPKVALLIKKKIERTRREISSFSSEINKVP